jgi:chromosome segregation ATPase
VLLNFELQHEYKNLQNKVHAAQYQKQKSERDLQVVQKQIMESTEVENMLHQNVDTLQDDIEHLHKERSELEQLFTGLKIAIGDIFKSEGWLKRL